ncbi:hypothetical protein, partial [Enterococcus faecium]
FTKFFLILETKRLFQNLLVNGVQKLASAVISSANSKTRKAVFAWLFLLLVAGQLFHNLSTKRCSIS